MTTFNDKECLETKQGKGQNNTTKQTQASSLFQCNTIA